MTLYLTVVYIVVLLIYLITNKFEIKEVISILLIMPLYILVYDKSISDIGYSRFLSIYITVPIILYVSAMFPSLFLMFTSIFDGIDIFYAKKVIRFIMSVCLILITIIIAMLR